jgi:hypothetical protein
VSGAEVSEAEVSRAEVSELKGRPVYLALGDGLPRLRRWSAEWQSLEALPEEVVELVETFSKATE